MKRFQIVFVFCSCILSVLPCRAHSQAANDRISRDETVDSIGDGVVADVLNGVEGIAQDSARAAAEEVRRDATKVESAFKEQKLLTPTSVPDSDESIGRDIEKLEELSQE
jgi:hypothetical protein